jgi:xanthine dehydrogenase YagS FAD-binding subunit
VKAFRYDRATTVEGAVKALADGTAILKANGIDVLDRLKERVAEPARVVTLVDVPGLDRIELEGSVLRVGSMVTLAALAASADVVRASPALAEAAGGAASPALRNRATLGGNLGQHTRCGYYRLKSFPCFKRGDAICPVRIEGGVQENAGIFDNAPCACAHPSSVAPVLGAAGAVVRVRGKGGERAVPFASIYGPVKQGQVTDLALAPDDVIVGVDLPALRPGVDHEATYEVRHKAAFDWALVTCAVRCAVEGGVIRSASVWMGSVAPSPWRSEGAEKALVGQPATAATAAAAAEAAVAGAHPLPGTSYKLDLVRASVRRALAAAWERK